MRMPLLPLLVALTILPAQAQSALWDEPTAPGAWRFRAGVMAFVAPAIPGSAQDRFLALPVFSANYDGRIFLGSSLVSVGIGGGWRLLKTEHLTWDLGLGVGENRPERRADELAGMGDRSADAFLGTGLRLHSGGWHVSLKVATGLAQDSGARATLDLGHGRRLASRLLGGLGVSGTWGTTQNLAWDFGVTPGQAVLRQQLLANGDGRLRVGEDRAYAPQGGLRELNASTYLVVLLPGRWQLFGALRATSLQGDARHSPLVRRTSYLSGALGASLSF